jgi:hypothetical protein
MPIFSLQQVQAAMLFYRHHCIAPLLASLLCCRLYATNGDAPAQYLSKIAIDSALLCFIFSLKPGTLYYYYNLHISRAALVVSFLLTDLVIFSVCLWITCRII